MSGEQQYGNKNNKPLISHSKARGILVLIGALLIFQVVTFILGIIQKRQLELVEKKTISSETVFTEPILAKKDTIAAFFFNPNTISKDSLVMLGFSPKQAQVVVNYRKKGGRFKRKEDFAKMYVVSEKKYEKLKGKIVIPIEPSYVRAESHRALPDKKTKKQTDTSIYGKKNIRGDSLTKKTIWQCNLNKADSAALVKLYGIGPYFARKIVRYRDRLGGWFVQAEQLLEIEGMEPERFEGIRDKLLIDTVGMRKFTLDTLGRVFMEKHPYIGSYVARGILMYRERSKKEGTVTLQDLVRENILSVENAARLKKYVKQ